jgi:hypothetical protein
MHLKLRTKIKYYFYKLKIINKKFGVIKAKIIKIIFKMPKRHLEYIIFNIAFIK